MEKGCPEGVVAVENAATARTGALQETGQELGKKHPNLCLLTFSFPVDASH